MNYQPGMHAINELVKELNELNSIVCRDGKWLNIERFQQFAKRMPEILEHATETQAYMLEILEYTAEIETQEGQEELEYEHKEVASA